MCGSLFHDSKTSRRSTDAGKQCLEVTSTGLPIDSDGDGVADYIEDANGDGDLQAGETDITKLDTDLDGRNDAYDIAYDGIDLDGDGMVGAVEKYYGKNR